MRRRAWTLLLLSLLSALVLAPTAPGQLYYQSASFGSWRLDGRLPVCAGYLGFEREPVVPPGKLTLFTRLAGMFMGNVSPVSVGGVRLYLSLEIR